MVLLSPSYNFLEPSILFKIWASTWWISTAWQKFHDKNKYKKKRRFQVNEIQETKPKINSKQSPIQSNPSKQARVNMQTSPSPKSRNMKPKSEPWLLYRSRRITRVFETQGWWSEMAACGWWACWIWSSTKGSDVEDAWWWTESIAILSGWAALQWRIVRIRQSPIDCGDGYQSGRRMIQKWNGGVGDADGGRRCCEHGEIMGYGAWWLHLRLLERNYKYGETGEESGCCVGYDMLGRSVVAVEWRWWGGYGVDLAWGKQERENGREGKARWVMGKVGSEFRVGSGL